MKKIPDCKSACRSGAIERREGSLYSPRKRLGRFPVSDPIGASRARLRSHGKVRRRHTEGLRRPDSDHVCGHPGNADGERPSTAHPTVRCGPGERRPGSGPRSGHPGGQRSHRHLRQRRFRGGAGDLPDDRAFARCSRNGAKHGEPEDGRAPGKSLAGTGGGAGRPRRHWQGLGQAASDLRRPPDRHQTRSSRAGRARSRPGVGRRSRRPGGAAGKVGFRDPVPAARAPRTST